MPYSLLHVASLRNDVNAARKYIEGGMPDTVHVWEGCESRLTIDAIDVDVRDHQGWTPLMIAATHGNLEMCRFLIESKASVHKKKNFAATPLHLACRGGYLEVAMLLVANNADPYAKKLDSCTPLHDAAWSGNSDLALFILDSTYERHKISRRESLKCCNNSGETPLHLASKRGYPQMVKLFLSFGASTYAKDDRGKVPHEVAKNRRTFLAFPEMEDPINVQCATVGAMSSDTLLSESHSQKLKSKVRSSRLGSIASAADDIAEILGSTAPGDQQTLQSLTSRPKTSDVANFTQSLGIRNQ